MDQKNDLNKNNNTYKNLLKIPTVLHTMVKVVNIVMDKRASTSGSRQLSSFVMKGTYKKNKQEVSLNTNRLGMMLSNANLHIYNSDVVQYPQDKSRLERGLEVVRHAAAWRQPLFEKQLMLIKEGFYGYPVWKYFFNRITVFKPLSRRTVIGR